MIDNWRTCACALAGIILGVCAYADKWWGMVVCFLLLIPYRTLGNWIAEGIVEAARWIRERREEQELILLTDTKRR